MEAGADHGVHRARNTPKKLPGQNRICSDMGKARAMMEDAEVPDEAKRLLYRANAVNTSQNML